MVKQGVDIRGIIIHHQESSTSHLTFSFYSQKMASNSRPIPRGEPTGLVQPSYTQTHPNTWIVGDNNSLHSLGSRAGRIHKHSLIYI